MGYIVIIKGMKQVFDGGEAVELSAAPASTEHTSTNKAGSFDMDIEFTYCTEYLVLKKADAKDAMLLRAHLETIGDSVVVVDDDEIIKVHVHTENPGNALEEGLKFGALTNMKIENMKEQHKAEAVKAGLQTTHKLAPERPEKKYGFVAIANGAGIETLFKDLGVDRIVRGGQTLNPSTEDILEKINETPSDVVFVLPNNKNIIMAAQQCAPMTEKRVIVIPTRSIPQGVSAMLAVEDGESIDEMTALMTEAAKHVRTALITLAARDSVFDGHEIKEGEYLALIEDSLAASGSDIESVIEEVAKTLGGFSPEFITVFIGEDVSEDDAASVAERISSSSPFAETSVIKGGQPVYHYIISAE
jgi:hypothetical protein